MSPLARALAALGALLVPAPALAAGFYIGDVGTRAQARGGAYVAAPDSVLAAHYNPSGLSLLRGLHFDVSVSVVDLDARFQRSCPCVSDAFRADDPMAAAAEEARLDALFDANVATTRTPLTIPFIGLAYGFEPLKLTVALAAYGPTSGRFDYGLLGSAKTPGFEERAETKVTRYNAVEAPNLELNYALAFGLEPLEGLRIGATFFLHQTGAGQTLHLFADTRFLAAGPEDTSADIPIVLDFLSDPAFNWQVGVGYDLPFVEGLSIGASFRGERSVSAKGTIEVDLPGSLDGVASVEGRDVDVSLTIAPIARAGIQYRRPGLFAAEVAYVWEGWSTMDRVVIEPRGIAFDLAGQRTELDTIISERNWRDTGSIRIGGELEMFDPWLGIQVGYFYEPSAIPRQWLDPSRIDLDKHGMALGLSSSFAGLTLRIAGTYIVMDGATVRDSQARNTAPLGFAPELRTTVGNGDFDGSYFIGSASLSFSLDAFSAS